MGCPVSFPHCQRVVPAFHPRSNGPASNLVKLQLIIPHLKFEIHPAKLSYPITVMYLPLVLWFLFLGSPTSGKQFWYSTCVTKWHTFFSDHGSALARSHDWWAAQHLCRRRNSLADFKHTIIYGNFASLLKAEIGDIQVEGIGGKWTDQQQDEQEQHRPPWVTLIIWKLI